MLRRPLAAAVALALLFFGAMISLEAIGVLFHTAVPDPQQRIDAFVARLEAELSPVDLPTEPVDVSPEARQEFAARDPERADAAEPAPELDGTRKATEVTDRVEPDGNSERLAAALVSTIPEPRPENAGRPIDELPAAAPVEPEAAAVVPGLLPTVRAAIAAPVAETAPRATGARRVKLTRGPAGYVAFGWPLLDWLTL